MNKTNPIIKADFPDPCVIRVEDTYYMLSTTMHFRPGAVILRSYDLQNWEIAGHVFDNLDNAPQERMLGERTAYGKGMWGGSLRYHNGKFYACFSAMENDRTYIFSADKIDGPWEKRTLMSYNHHPSLLFDEDGRVYLVSGFREISIRELKADLTDYKADGLNKVLLEETEEEVYHGYEGSHFQKINGKYYLFVIYWPKAEPARRTQLCFIADSLEGEFVRYEVLRDDMGFYNQGVAQGGLIDTPTGKWYSIMYQHRGALGRMPVLMPVSWNGDVPVFGRNGKVPEKLEVAGSRPYYQYAPLYTSDTFEYAVEAEGKPVLKPQWEWNHIPNDELWGINEGGGLYIQTGKVSTNVVHAVNTLTQRMMWPECAAEVTVDASDMKNGDVAGMCAFQGCYGLIGITKEYGSFYLVVINRQIQHTSIDDLAADYMPGTLIEKVKLTEGKVRIRINADFEGGKDEVEFFYQNKNRWKRIGGAHKLYFKMDHFMGCRFGLFAYATREKGGKAVFTDFRYLYEED